MKKLILASVLVAVAALFTNQGSITKEMTKVGTPKRNSDTTKIYDEGRTTTYYFEKVQTQ